VKDVEGVGNCINAYTYENVLRDVGIKTRHHLLLLISRSTASLTSSNRE